jgi:hypothetical protein
MDEPLKCVIFQLVKETHRASRLSDVTDSNARGSVYLGVRSDSVSVEHLHGRQLSDPRSRHPD